MRKLNALLLWGSLLLLFPVAQSVWAAPLQGAHVDSVGCSVKSLGMAQAVVALPSGGFSGQNPASTAFQPGIVELKGLHLNAADASLKSSGFLLRERLTNGVSLSARPVDMLGIQGSVLDSNETFSYNETNSKHVLLHRRYSLGSSIRLNNEWSMGAHVVFHRITRKKEILQPEVLGARVHQEYAGASAEFGVLGYPAPQFAAGFWFRPPLVLEPSTADANESPLISAKGLALPARFQWGGAWLPVAEASGGHWFPGGHLVTFQLDGEFWPGIQHPQRLRHSFVVAADAEPGQLWPQAVTLPDNRNQADIRLRPQLLFTPRVGLESLLLRYPQVALIGWLGSYADPSRYAGRGPLWTPHVTFGARALLWALVLEVAYDYSRFGGTGASGLGVAFDI